jgi:hypothetical protein
MCHHRGTYGRIAIYETLVVSDEIRTIVARRPHDMEALVRRAAIRGGMQPLRRWGLDLVKRGEVALSQVADATPYIPDDALEVVWESMVDDGVDDLGFGCSVAPREPLPPFDPRADGENPLPDFVRPIVISPDEYDS